MQNAVIDTQTRIISRLSTAKVPFSVATESIVVLSKDIDLAGGGWKLDVNNKQVKATQAEIDTYKTKYGVTSI